MMFRVVVIKKINMRIMELKREIIKIKKSYLKDSLPYLTYA